MLQSVTPAAGSTATDVREVRLAFNGALREELSAVVVTGPDGNDVADGPPSASGGSVVQPLRGPLPDGRWTVAYRVVAADGHPVTGTSTFLLEGQAPAESAPAPQESPPAPQESPPAPPAQQAESEPAAAPAPAPPSDGSGGPAVLRPALAAGALIALAGGGLLLGRRRAGRPPGLGRAPGRLSST